MLTETTVRDSIARFSAVEDSLIAKYGPNAQARVFFLYEQLVTIRHAMLEEMGAAVRGLLHLRRLELRRTIQSLYDSADYPDTSPPVRRLPGRHVIHEYDRAVFDSRYADFSDLIREEVLPLMRWRPDLSVRPVAYMYVVDDNGEFLVWSRPFRLADLVLGRTFAAVGGQRVGHPLLVPDRLRVLAAGEVVPIGSAPVSGVVANLKSGHFRPSPPAAQAVVEACAAIGLTEEDCDVFTLPG